MTRAKELLDAATPTGKRILRQDYRGNEDYTVTRKDILAIEAESREDYETAMKALERLVFLGRRIGGGGTNGELWLPFQDAIRDGGAALRRLRDEVSA